MTNLFAVADKVAEGSTLFRAGFKAEVYWDDVTAHHMNTRSIYTFRENPNISITHSAPIVNGESVDEFRVSKRTILEYHNSGTVYRSETKTIGTFDKWLSAYYCALQQL